MQACAQNLGDSCFTLPTPRSALRVASLPSAVIKSHSTVSGAGSSCVVHSAYMRCSCGAKVHDSAALMQAHRQATREAEAMQNPKSGKLPGSNGSIN